MLRYTCKAVGSIIKNEAGLYLVVYRLKDPKGLAMPAGHIKYGEDAGDAIRRETLEETGIRIINMRRNSERLIDIGHHNRQCTRGATFHDWIVFEVLTWEGEPQRCEPDKHEFVRFMSSEEISQYVEKGDVDPSWSKFIWKERGILCKK